METAATSSEDRAVVERRSSKQRSRITNGALLPGIDQRSAWVRRCKDVIASHLSDIPDATAAERSIIRRASVLTVELERLERQFALAGEADPETLDLYGRVAGNMRRLLESVGLERRARDVSPTLADYLSASAAEAADAGAD
jgi:hypothetical protein